MLPMLRSACPSPPPPPTRASNRRLRADDCLGAPMHFLSGFAGFVGRALRPGPKRTAQEAELQAGPKEPDGDEADSPGSTQDALLQPLDAWSLQDLSALRAGGSHAKRRRLSAGTATTESADDELPAFGGKA